MKGETQQVFTDLFGRHNVFSRLMIVACTSVFVYSYLTQLNIAYTEMVTWLFFGIFACITFGVNVFQHLGDLIQKIKGTYVPKDKE